jgi:hypothetical protein
VTVVDRARLLAAAEERGVPVTGDQVQVAGIRVNLV